MTDQQFAERLEKWREERDRLTAELARLVEEYCNAKRQEEKWQPPTPTG